MTWKQLYNHAKKYINEKDFSPFIHGGQVACAIETNKGNVYYGINFDTAFLPYPLYDMHGKSYAGLSTFSKYQINSAERVEYTISDSLSKLFDID